MVFTDLFLEYLVSLINLDALNLIYFEKSICACFVCFRGNEESSSVMEYCMTIMGYNVFSSSSDYVPYVTKFVQAWLCYQ